MKPSFAPRIYRDHRYLYLELADGQQTLRFEFTDDGLHKALKLIPSITDQPGYLSGGANIFDRIVIDKMKNVKVDKATKAARGKLKLTPEQQLDADEIVRKMK